MGDLRAIATRMVGGGRGILAADESTATMSGRLEKVGVAGSEEHRRAYREMLITTPDLSKWISGVILSDDILRAQLTDGRPFPAACLDAGVLAGIKVDTGAKPLAHAPGESVTEGLDGLRERLATYVQMGASFTKWRAVIRIGDSTPSQRALAANAHALARYAALAQEAGLVPIVEPEVLMDGDHALERCEDAAAAILRAVFGELVEQGVSLEGMVLKPNMVTAGKDNPRQAAIEEVASATIRVLRRCVPAAVPGIAFLSGGQPPELATAHLAALVAHGPHPWELTFSFGRALVDPALRAWRGDERNVASGQEALAARCRANAEARALIPA
ncbi:MAG TPA: class I fructose-bisphosphate aldolase [Candidatus Dormibacteraeota bacterium]